MVVEVKRRLGLVNDIHASAYTPRDPGLFSASITAPPANVAKALEETTRVLAELRVRPVSADELATVKAQASERPRVPLGSGRFGLFTRSMSRS